MSVDSAGLRVLTSIECLELLREVTVGRVAVSHRALPMILPVHFRLDDAGRIRIAAAPGSTLHHATAGTVVAFEADGPAGSVEPTWSVVLHGLATHSASAAAVPLPRRTDVLITIDQISGRALPDVASPPLTRR
jgi:nitroimidazol reductase NimA-like FMN-containing flavoprotein (pyridoxamine 5'-phosphate oxidase superfamily)